MGVYINMEMPKNCDTCVLLCDDGDYPMCRATGEQRGYNFRTREQRMDRCPLVPVPRHGRLVDADELKTAFPCGESVRTECVRATIDHAPTIIPAEEKQL